MRVALRTRFYGKLHDSPPLYCVRCACYEFVSKESVRKVTVEQFISSSWDIKRGKEGRKEAKNLRLEMQIRAAMLSPRLRDQRTTTWIRLSA